MSTSNAMESASKAMDSAKEAIGEYAQQPVKMVQEHPIPASLVLFGLGMGIGIAIASSVAQTMVHQETTTERLGRQFNDALSEIRSTIQRGLSGIR